MTSSFTLRPLTATDESALIDFHERCSDETHYLRFFGSKPHLSEGEARWFCAVEDRRCGAVVAVDPDDPGRILGVGRWERLEDGAEAEGAWVVDDAHQGRGVGTALLEAVMVEARAHGVRWLVGEVLAHNVRMRRLLSRSGMPCAWSWDDGIASFRVDLESLDERLVTAGGLAAAQP